MTSTGLALIKTMRPKHWVENLVVFAALLYLSYPFLLAPSITITSGALRWEELGLRAFWKQNGVKNSKITYLSNFYGKDFH